MTIQRNEDGCLIDESYVERKNFERLEKKREKRRSQQKEQQTKNSFFRLHPQKTLENKEVVVEMLRQETWLTSLQGDIQRNVDMNKKKRAMKYYRGRHPNRKILPPGEDISVRALYQAAIGEEQ